MIINKISTNYSNYYTNANVRKSVSSPSFGYRVALETPKINNISGEQIYNKALQWIARIPEGTKMSQPVSVNVTEDGLGKVYGVLVDKTKKDILEIIFVNLTNNKNWKEMEPGVDLFKADFDTKTGKMIAGSYDGMFFYRNKDNRDRKIKTENARYAPLNYGSKTWGLTTYGEHKSIFNNVERENTPLSSIFWAFTNQNASILNNNKAS